VDEGVPQGMAGGDQEERSWTCPFRIERSLWLRFAQGQLREDKPRMIKTVFLFANGNVACCDEHGQQVPEENNSAWFHVLQDKLDRGVISEDTELYMAGWESRDGKKSMTVFDLMVRGNLEKKENG